MVDIQGKQPTRFEYMQQMGGMGAGLGGLLAPMFGGMQNSFDEANPYLQKMQGATDRYMNPYINAGRGAMGTLQDQYNSLINDPGALMGRLGAGYKQSPGYQYNVDQATRASNNAASAGGFVGSPQQQAQMAKQIGGMASQDYDKYMNNAMGLYGTGLQGMGNINQMGFNASTQGMNSVNDMLKTQAQLAYANANNQNQSEGGMFGGLGGLLGAGLGFMSPIPGGAAMGAKLGSGLFR